MEQPQDSKNRGKEKFKNKKTLILAALAALVLISSAIAFLPSGAVNAWHQIFSYFGLNEFSDASNPYPMSMHVLDVGKADSILIASDGHYMLVDGGTADCGDKVSKYLSRKGVKTLDLVVNTHPDKDHIGGLNTVIKNFHINMFLAPNIPETIVPNSSEYRNVQKSLLKKHLAVTNPVCGETRTLGKLKVEVLAPIKQRDSTNNNSIVLRLTYGSTTFLLMGDAEKDEEADLLASGAKITADVLKVGHHGSSTSTTQALLNAVKPSFAAVSVGRDSGKLLPKTSVLKRIQSAGAKIFRTDVNGTLIFMSNGQKITVQTER